MNINMICKDKKGGDSINNARERNDVRKMYCSCSKSSIKISCN